MLMAAPGIYFETGRLRSCVSKRFRRKSSPTACGPLGGWLRRGRFRRPRRNRASKAVQPFWPPGASPAVSAGFAAAGPPLDTPTIAGRSTRSPME
jgi:hypothetical protein